MRQFCDIEISRAAYIFLLQNTLHHVLHSNKSHNSVCDYVKKQGLEYGINSVIILQHLDLLGFWTLLIVRYSKEH
jgi:hypothetical protein